MYSLGHGSTVVGDLKFIYEGDVTKKNRNGYPIPRVMDYNVTDLGGQSLPVAVSKMRDIRSDAWFILVVESAVMLVALHRSNFEKKYKCIIVNGSGFPSVCTRKFIRTLTLKLNLPVLAITDGDINGFKILANYRYGSKIHAYDSESLAIPRLYWLGIRPSDLAEIPARCARPLSAANLVSLNRLMEEDYLLHNQRWKQELSIMLNTRTQIEMFRSVEHSQYFAEVFLPSKLERGDWI